MTEVLLPSSKCPAPLLVQIKRYFPSPHAQQQHYGNSASMCTLQKLDPTRMANKCFRLSLAFGEHMGVIYWHEYLEAVLITTVILVHWFQTS